MDISFARVNGIAEKLSLEASEETGTRVSFKPDREIFLIRCLISIR